ncbi:MAG: AAA family ATPase [Alteromonadaceae bacterium]|nr:AAA family ATPase [Alteromonadaceae bacterium]|tara:strand:+ start:98 stop:1003 length:906 start_codon:yes stop_codon:yes gene_type:complete
MKKLIQNTVDRLNQILLGKDEQVRLSLCCVLARGHLLIEDIPGMGKTTLSHALAQTLGLTYQRIQFTSDLLPADILGYSLFERDTGTLRFHPGPIFAQVILADEINRASPRTQSALLEAMEERQVTIEGETRPLPSPFFVIATQNPLEQGGTFPLPESQLDRFLMRLNLGYPTAEAERQLLEGIDRRVLLDELAAELTPDTVQTLQAGVDRITTSGALLDYVQRILAYTRQSSDIHHGLSPRAGLGLVRAARAWAMMDGRHHVLPEDVQAVLPYVVEHRLQRREGQAPLAPELLEKVAVIA